MIRRLRGRVEELGWSHAVLDVGGVGFLLSIPLSTRQLLQQADGREVTLHVHTRWREERLELYGFGRPDELELFELLLQVGGIGPKTALAALSTLDPEQLLVALAEGQVERLRRVPGVGQRLAERLCLELREKARERLGQRGAAGADGVPRPSPPPERHPAAADAVAALVALGYSRAEARHAVRRAAGRLSPQQGVEELVRAALTAMAGEQQA